MTETEQVLRDEVTSLQGKLLALTSELDAKTASAESLASQLDATSIHLAEKDAVIAALTSRSEAKAEVGRILFQNGDQPVTEAVRQQLKVWVLGSNG